MRRIAYKLLAIIFVMILFSPVFSLISGGKTAGEHGGTLKCDSNLQLIPQSGSVGGGNIHWHLEGEAAREFRAALLDSVGNDTVYTDANGDDTLDSDELDKYIRSGNVLESYIQRGGELRGYRDQNEYLNMGLQRDIEPEDTIKYYGIKITRSSLNTDSISDDTKGLLGTERGSTEPIDIHFQIGLHSGPGTSVHEINMADHRIATAIWDSLFMPVRERLITNASSNPQRSFQLQHDNLIVHEGQVQGLLMKNNTIIPRSQENYTYTEDGQLDINMDIDQGDNITAVYLYRYYWEGKTTLSHWSFVVGINSFYEPNKNAGTNYLFRTPAGEVLYYKTSYEGYEAPTSTIKWDDMKILENPQLLFVIVAIFAYFTAAMPKKYYRDYRSEYPLKYQSRAEKAGYIHILAKLAAVGLLLLYFVPAIGPLFVQGLYLIILSPALMVASAIFSKMIYGKKKSDIPEEMLHPPQPKRRPQKITRRTKKPKNNVQKVFCERCGEVFTIPKSKNLLSVRCPVCGKRQRELKEGYNYLLLEENGDHSYSIYKDFVREGITGLIITTNLPSKIKEKHGLLNQDIKWISESSSEDYEVLDPKRLDFEITRTIKQFADKHDRAVLLIEGIEYLVIENGFEEVSKFIKKVTDITSMNAITLLVHVNPKSFSVSQLSTLKKEFDNSEDLRDNNQKKAY